MFFSYPFFDGLTAFHFLYPSGRRGGSASLALFQNFTAKILLAVSGFAWMPGCASGIQGSSSGVSSSPTPDFPVVSPGGRAPLLQSNAVPGGEVFEGELTLNQAVALAVVYNPRLQALLWEAEGARGRLRQAKIWPNPELEFEMENIGGNGSLSGTGSAENTLSLAQHLPLGGDISRHTELTALRVELADWRYHAARLEVVLDVTQWFVQTLASERKLELATEALELAASIERIAKARVEAGDASPLELSRVLVPVVTAEVQVAGATRLRDANLQQLALSWGGRGSSIRSLSGSLDAMAPLPAPDRLVSTINRHPEVAVWTTGISARVAERRLLEARAMPDLTVRLGVRKDNRSDEKSWVAGISFPLPLFDRAEGNIAAARAGETAATHRKRAEELRIESLIHAAYVALATARDEAVVLRDRALPAATQAYQATEIAFQEGKVPFIDVLDAQRTLFDLRERHLNALTSYHVSLAEMEALIGRSLKEFE